jgi:hypothetical protein
MLAIQLAGCGGNGPVEVPGVPGNAIPRGALRALQAEWAEVEVGTSISAVCPNATGAPALGVTGDFNGDGGEDLALWATSRGTTRLVALIARLDGEYTAHQIGDDAVATAGTLEVAPRGTRYALASLSLDFYFGTDTVVLRRCDDTKIAYFWTGDTFQPSALAN